MSEGTAWGQVGKINGHFLRASACAGIAWACWQGFEAGSILLGMFTAIFACGAVWHGLIATFQTLRILIGSFKWRRFKRGGAAPKADPVAGEDALRAGGLIK